MNKFIFLLLIVFTTIVSCDGDSIYGSKKIVKKTFDIVDFTKIETSNTFSVKVTQGDKYKVELTCNENILELIDIKKSGKTLKLDVKGAHSFSDITLKVNIKVPNLVKIKARGASKIKLSKLNLERLKVNISGASSLKGELKISDEIDINASGASSIKLKGNAKNAKFDFSGASSLNAKDFLVSDTLSIDASGASACKILSKGAFKMKSSGASSIHYYGKGKILKKEISGAGEIERMFKV